MRSGAKTAQAPEIRVRAEFQKCDSDPHFGLAFAAKHRLLIKIATNLAKLACLSFAVSCFAQSGQKQWHVGWLSPATAGNASRNYGLLVNELRRAGYEEGKNLRIDARWAGNRAERLPTLAAELADLRVDVIVAQSMAGVQAAIKVTTSIPIVMVNVSDPVGAGLIKSFAFPGGNVTGPASIGIEIIDKRLELLHSMVPGAKRVAVLYNGTSDNARPSAVRARAGGARLGINVAMHSVRNELDLKTFLAGLRRQKTDALLMVSNTLFTNQSDRINQAALEQRIPTMYWVESAVALGGLMSYGPNIPDEIARAAGYVDRIFKGARPADLPVEQPNKLELVINRKTAAAIGLTIPPQLLLQADRVIE